MAPTCRSVREAGGVNCVARPAEPPTIAVAVFPVCERALSVDPTLYAPVAAVRGEDRWERPTSKSTQGDGSRIVVFAKRPRAGEVKTRLAVDLGPEAALNTYVELLTGVLMRLGADARWRVELAVSPDAAVNDASAWPVPTPRFAQGPGDLGARMARVLAQARPEAPVLIVGSDVPGLGAPEAAAALDTLEAVDLVLGPAPDGGYWAIGARRPPPDGLFANVRWSTEHARADTLRNAAGLNVAVLDAWFEDVDDLAAYRRWRGEG